MANNAVRIGAGSLLVAGGVVGIVSGAETYGQAEQVRQQEANLFASAWHAGEDTVKIVSTGVSNWLDTAGLKPEVGPTDIPGQAYQGLGEMAVWSLVTISGGYMAASGWKRARGTH